MADSGLTGAHHLTQKSFNTKIPPGWNPYMKDYPFAEYMRQMNYWIQCADVHIEQMGPLAAGRLSGRAAQIAQQLTVDRIEVNIDRNTGIATPVLDPVSGTPKLLRYKGAGALCLTDFTMNGVYYPSGLNLLLGALK